MVMAINRYYIPSFPGLSKKAIISNATNKVLMEYLFLIPLMALDWALRKWQEEKS